jgi:hypothetical protein
LASWQAAGIILGHRGTDLLEELERSAPIPVVLESVVAEFRQQVTGGAD